MNKVEQIFQRANLKSTSSRHEVLNVLLNTKNPLTHQEILKSLSLNFDRVTLYRVLDWLLKNKLIHKIAGADRSWRFQFNQDVNNLLRDSQIKSNFKYIKPQPHTHAHFQCTHCGKVFCLENIYPKLTNRVPVDFLVDSIELNITGICKTCQS
jgi:Fur family transcriptional regulator, ferric uptake regulator